MALNKEWAEYEARFLKKETEKIMPCQPEKTVVRYLPDEARVVRGPLLWWQKRGLMYTRSGYGSKIPTEYQVHWNNRIYRVYCGIYSNNGVMYILSKKQRYYIHDWQFPTR